MCSDLLWARGQTLYKSCELVLKERQLADLRDGELALTSPEPTLSCFHRENSGLSFSITESLRLLMLIMAIHGSVHYKTQLYWRYIPAVLNLKALPQ